MFIASFCTMNDIILVELVSLLPVFMCRIRNRIIPFIIQKLQYQGCVTLPMLVFLLTRYLYFSSVSFFGELLSLLPVNMCRVRNRTIMFII